MPRVLRKHGELRWQRSNKGNLYTRLKDGATVTIFRSVRDEDGFRWCIFTGDGPPRFSRRSWDSERDAQRAALDELEERELV